MAEPAPIHLSSGQVFWISILILACAVALFKGSKDD
jgi:hypothetical protein